MTADPILTKFMLKEKFYFVVPLFATKPERLIKYIYALNNPLIKFDPEGTRVQAKGCDLIPDSIETKCRLDCCEEHDNCFARIYNETKGAIECKWEEAWPATLSGRPDSCYGPCEECNAIVSACWLKCEIVSYSSIGAF
jgi:hypothetical protein